MNFEHLIEINALDNPFTDVLTHEQLWLGILHRVEDPLPFLPGLERCDIVARGENWVERVLHFGSVTIRDRVLITHRESVSFVIAPTAEHAGGSLTIAIEARSDVALFLRFTYGTHHPAAADDEQYADYIRAAYEQSDLDMVNYIRELANAGKLVSTLH